MIKSEAAHENKEHGEKNNPDKSNTNLGRKLTFYSWGFFF